MEVALVRWPGEQERLGQLRAVGAPRLLLVEAGVSAPTARDPSEDWIRLPASEADIRARVDGIAARARLLDNLVPALVDGVLSLDGERIVLSPLEARLAACLVPRYGLLVEREELLSAGWPDGTADRNDLDVHILRLRRRIAPLGLALKTVRSKGYVLDAEEVRLAAAPFDGTTKAGEVAPPSEPKKPKKTKPQKRKSKKKAKKKSKKKKST